MFTSWNAKLTRDGRDRARHLAASSARPRPSLQSEHDDLLRDPARARGRALRQDGRVLQGQPERDRHRRPPRGRGPAQGPLLRRDARRSAIRRRAGRQARFRRPTARQTRSLGMPEAATG
jgi:hypothetical protein